MNKKLYLPGFFVHTSGNEEKSCILIHPRTGQLFFNCDQDGNVAKVYSKRSYWTRPSETYKSITQIRQDSNNIREVLKKWEKDLRYHSNKNNEVDDREDDDDFHLRETLINIYGPRRAKEIAIHRIQHFLRRMYGIIQMKRQIQKSYTKYFDKSTNLYYFINLLPGGERQWYRPIGLGIGCEYDIPEVTKNKKDGDNFFKRKSKELESLNPKILDVALSRHYVIEKQNDNFLDGPYCKLIKGKPGKKMLRGLGKHNFDSINRKSSMLCNGEIMNDIGLQDLHKKIPLQDGLKLVHIKIDPYTMIIAAYNKGIMDVVHVVKYHHTDQDIIYHGCRALAKFQFKETEEGTASAEAMSCINYCSLELIQKWKHHPMIISSVLLVLVNLSDFFPNRVVVNTTKWVDIVKFCLVIIEANGANYDFIDTAINVAKFLFNMSCDDKIRESTSKIGFPILMHIMSLYENEPSVQAAGCSTLFNFVFKNGNTCSPYYIKVQKLISHIKVSFPNEYDLILIAERTMKEFHRLCNGLN